MEENGSPPPIFETDENNAYFLCTLTIHPLAESILGQEDDLRRDEDKVLKFSNLIEINPHLSLLVSEIGDQDKEGIKERINLTIRGILNYCKEPKSKDELFEELGLYKNTKNHNHHIKPLLVAGWLNLTLPNKPTSKNQQYYTTELGKKLLLLISEEQETNIKRIPVVSSNIAAIGYDKEENILEIEFHHGAIYQYIDVPEKVYIELINSSAKASYFMNEIKGKFEYQKQVIL